MELTITMNGLIHLPVTTELCIFISHGYQVTCWQVEDMKKKKTSSTEIDPNGFCLNNRLSHKSKNTSFVHADKKKKKT